MSNTANISSMVQILGPRRISRWRRVTVPAAVRALGFEPDACVVVGVLPEGSRGLRLQLAGDAARQAARPRRVTAHGQISIPAAVMGQAGLGPLDSVFFVADGRLDVRMVAAEQVRASFSGVSD
jgi:hypothetical protein